MPHFTHDDVYDNGLAYLKANCNKMVLTDGEPANFADANANMGVGSGQKVSEVAMASGDFTLANGDTSGRKVTCAAKAAQAVVANGDGEYVAYLDTLNSKILHYYPIATARPGLTTADSVNFPVHDYEVRDVIAE